MYCRKLLWHDRALGRNGGIRCWSILAGLGLSLHELFGGPVSSIRRFDELHQLPRRHLSRHGRRVNVDMHGMHCWELLWHDRALGRDGGMRRWSILTGLCLSLHELCCGPVSNYRRFDDLHQLPRWHLSRHGRRVDVDLHGVYCWKLLRHIRSIGRLRSLCGGLLFDCFSVHLFVVRLGLLPSGSRFVELFGLCRGKLLGSSFKRVLQLRCRYV